MTDPAQLARIHAIEQSIPEMSEPELALLIDSLFSEEQIPAALIGRIRAQAELLRSEAPKNHFDDGFALYPGNRYYGIWDTRHLFPYSDSLYKADTTLQLDLSQTQFYFPFDGPVTSTFGFRDSAMHRGVDIDLQRGDPVHAAFDGMVRFAANSGGFGNVVIVRHYNGLETVYAHLWRIKVKPGDIVLAGQVLGLGGSTGHSTGTHLHFETRFRGVAVNPAYFISLEKHVLLADAFELKRTKAGYSAYPPEQEFYTVSKGDNLSEIAKRYGITTKQIRTLNNMEGRYRLKAGQQLKVRSTEVRATKL